MMNKLSSINLNYLIAFDALLAEQNTSRAAKKINLTQPAVSQILRQLREIFEDELLIRGHLSSQMILTAKAKELKEPVRDAIRQLEKIFTSNEDFDPQKTKQSFNIGIGDQLFIMLPDFIKTVNSKAPGIKINIIACPKFMGKEDFEEKKLDLIIGNYDKDPLRIENEILFSDIPVCIADKNHPDLQENLSMESFINNTHIISCQHKDVQDYINAKTNYEKKNKVRSIVATVPNKLVAMSMLRNTNFLGMIPEKMAMAFKDVFGLIIRKPPFKIPEQEFKMYWLPVDNNNNAHKWLRQIIKSIAGKL